ITFLNIKRTDGINAIDSTELSPIAARNSGDNKPIDKLLMKENAAMVEIFPPKIPVITGAEAAVGASTQIMAACANVVLNLKNNK
ncbi:MAG TPA: hypothetical protein VJY12_08500, partial [Dysgonamonadaceae bacterium]|nr:hypothetical protein [Dysgonamonadaceae bacterium]